MEMPFDAILNGPAESSGPVRWCLGKLGDVRVRNCPFCQLVAPTCEKFYSYRDPSIPSNDDKVIWVYSKNDNSLWAESTRPGTGIFFVADDKPRSISGDAAYAKSSFNEWIDFEDVKNWIAICDNRAHKDCSPIPFSLAVLPQNDGRQLDFRLIDVEDIMCCSWPPERQILRT
jgi:hypothetical protein